MMTYRVVFRSVIALAVIVIIAVAGFIAIVPRSIALSDAGQPEPLQAELVQRGEYLARAGDCVACHTAPGGQPYAGGLPLDTPFGTIVASNITPDRTTGIGGWTDQAFIRALRRGVSTDGHLLYPAMPYTAYARVTDSDLLAIKAFLATQKAVNNPINANQLPFPFNIRQLMLGWNLLFFRGGEFKPSAGQSELWNRGAYLVDGLGHCAACHAAKNLLGGDKAYLQGGELQGWYAPEITGNAYNGLGSWSVEQIATYLKSGANAHSVASGPMAEAVINSTQYLNDPDLTAIATYLKSLPGSDRRRPQPVAVGTAGMLDGKRLFDINCSACHTSSGAGVRNMVPALANSPSVQAPDPTNLIRVLLAGGAGAATKANPTGAEMPAFDWKLKDKEMTSVVNYIRNSWGNAAAAIDENMVSAARKSLHAGSRP
jgi:mono/diheme cytochrome c family protein